MMTNSIMCEKKDVNTSNKMLLLIIQFTYVYEGGNHYSKNLHNR